MGERDIGAVDAVQLVRRAAGGDRWAWERLVDQYARLLWAMTRDFKLMESDAADVAQMTWLRLQEHIDRLEEPARVGSWLAATARRECSRNMAARRKRVLVHDATALDDVAVHQPQVDERLLAGGFSSAVADRHPEAAARPSSAHDSGNSSSATSTSCLSRASCEYGEVLPWARRELSRARERLARRSRGYCYKGDSCDWPGRCSPSF